MTAFEKLIEWRDKKIQESVAAGKEFFLELPDEWYDSITYADETGHISHRYLKSEEMGNVCLECQKPVVLVPPSTTEEELREILK